MKPINSLLIIARATFIGTCLFLQSCSSLTSTGNNPPEEVVLFCGNPGVGKSTLCNSIFGKAVFKSGISLGKGLTKEKQEYFHENKLYVDTPGLDDIEIRKKAAREIEEALKHNNNYKIIFVATLDRGRIRPADLATINIVCDAIKADFEYGLVFNQVTKAVFREIMESGIPKEVLAQYLGSLNKKPSSYVILKRVEDMEDEKDMYFKSSDENRKEFINFLSNLKSNKIAKEEVKEIKEQNFEALVEKMTKELKETIDRLHRTIDEQRQEINNLKTTAGGSCVVL